MIEFSEDALMQADCLVWCDRKGLQLSQDVPFELKGRPYLKDIVNCNKRVMSVIKGSQVGVTTAKFLEAVHGCVYRHYTKNIIYMLPTVKQAEVLSRVSFDPIFSYNGFLKKKLNANSASLKTINGRSIVFVGAQPQRVGETATKDSINLRTIPGDAVYRDEYDMMNQNMVTISKQRLNDSVHRIECNFSTPTIPDYGIDLLFHEGDQRYFQIKCQHCGKHTCLVTSFPNSVLFVGGRWRRSCVHCGKEIYTNDGSFEAEKPNSRNASFWVSGLMSPNADLEEYMHRYHTSEGSAMAEFERSILGRAAIEASCQLSEADVRACRSNQGMSTCSTSECCIGVDTGNGLHIVVGYRTAEATYRILMIEHIESKDISFDPYQRVHDICDKFNVACGVLDLGPDIHAVRKFQTTEQFETFRCTLPDNFGNKPRWDHNEKRVRADRNEWCGKVHSTVTGGNLQIPRGCPEIDDFCMQLTKLAKHTDINQETGVPKTRWIKVGDKNDHYFHATLYWLLACSQRSPVREEGPRKQMKLRSKFHV